MAHRFVYRWYSDPIKGSEIYIVKIRNEIDKLEKKIIESSKTCYIFDNQTINFSTYTYNHHNNFCTHKHHVQSHTFSPDHVCNINNSDVINMCNDLSK